MPLPSLTAEQLTKPPSFELRMSLLYIAVFLPLGIQVPYFPLWLQASGFDANEIGVILAAPMFLRVLTTPFLTAMADRAGDRVTVLLVLSALAFVASLGYFLSPLYALVLATSLGLAVAITPQTPLADGLALSGVRRFHSVYARMRIWGSIAFLAANFGGGLILADFGASAVPVMLSAALFSVLVASLVAPRLGRPRRSSPIDPAELARLARAVVRPGFVLLVGGGGLIAGSHAFLYGFASIYWRSIGLSESAIGFLWSASVLAEVGMFLAFTRTFARLSSPMVLIVAGVVAMIRWIAFPAIEPLGLGLGGFVVVQVLHAFSTGLILIGVQKIIAEAIPEERMGAAQGIAYFANGFSLASATLASGPLYASFGVDGFYLMALVAIGGVAMVGVARLYPQRSGPGGDTVDPAYDSPGTRSRANSKGPSRSTKSAP